LRSAWFGRLWENPDDISLDTLGRDSWVLAVLPGIFHG
jgi:hypothetical protein